MLRVSILGYIAFAQLCACASSGAQELSPRERERADAGQRPARPDARAGEEDASAAPSQEPLAAGRGCPLRVSVATRSYGSGDEAQDDYAPRNVGAIWVSARERGFVRTVALWGPGYYEYAETWLAQSRGSRVDITTQATRSTHMRNVEAEWDCLDAKGALVPAGEYQLNVEFTEAEMQGPVLSGDKAIEFALGDAAAEVVREPAGFFGEIRIAPSAP